MTSIAQINLHVTNRHQARGIRRLARFAKKRLGHRPEAITVQEGDQLATRARVWPWYRVVSSPRGGDAARTLVCVRRRRKILVAEFHKGNDGFGNAMNHRARWIAAVGFETRSGRRLLVIADHEPLVDERALATRTRAEYPEAGQQYASHVDVTMALVARFEAEGWEVIVGADQNAAPGVWDGSLAARLKAAGFNVFQHDLDIVACRAQATRCPIVPKKITGSDHNGIVLSVV